MLSVEKREPTITQVRALLYFSRGQWPERIFPCEHGVTAVDFSLAKPHLLAVGMASGRVAIYDVRSRGVTALLDSRSGSEPPKPCKGAARDCHPLTLGGAAAIYTHLAFIVRVLARAIQPQILMGDLMGSFRCFLSDASCQKWRERQDKWGVSRNWEENERGDGRVMRESSLGSSPGLRHSPTRCRLISWCRCYWKVTYKEYALKIIIKHV